MSVKKVVAIISASALLAGCSTTTESPIYQQSTKYKVHSPYGTGQATQQATTQQASYPTSTYTTTTQPVYTNASTPQVYHTSTSTTGQVQTTQVNHECMDKEGNRKLIGTAVGGALGAFAGNKLGDTTGTVIGAVAGGAAGYGIADMTVDCDPIPAVAPTANYHSSTQYVTPAQPQPVTMTTSGAASPGPIILSPQETEQMVYASETTNPESFGSSTANGQAPTDSAYGDTFGTPGYHAMVANGGLDETTTASVVVPEAVPAPTQPAIPAPTQQYPQASAPSYPQTTYAQPSYPQPTYPQSSGVQSYPQAQITAPAPQYAQAGVTNHLVVEGDTVYSLSRRLCVDVEDIRRLNTLNSEFYIRLDEYIKLPASRC